MELLFNVGIKGTIDWHDLCVLGNQKVGMAEKLYSYS